MKFKYYITDSLEGLVFGTDSEALARDFAQGDDYYVVDVQENIWLQRDGFDVTVKEHV